MFEHGFSVSSVYNSCSGIAGSYCNSLFEHIYKTAGLLFSTSAAHFTVPPAMYEGSSFSTSSQTLLIFWACFCYGHPSGYEMVFSPHCSFYLLFLLTNDREPFLCLCWPFVYHLWRNVYSSHFKILIVFFSVELQVFLRILNT